MLHRVDVAIIGSGFAGSILAWILARNGMRVALIDKASHPRFAIGESSTPIADTILRRLGESFDLPELRDLSCWGSWQRTHPQLPCGRKRGFSYFVHQPGVFHRESRLGEQSLLVAASADDEVADTHWYRPELDTFFWKRAISAGASDLTGHEVVALNAGVAGESVIDCRGAKFSQVSCRWLVDASGPAATLAHLTERPDLADQFRTRSHSTFAHYRGVRRWSEIASVSRGSEGRGADVADPFDPDDAAQHHLLGDGWMWMLRFNNGITSVGFTTSLDQELRDIDELASAYPSIGELMQDATRVAPPGGVVRSGRLQRWFDPLVAPGQVMLPTAAVTLDPLHSTGIAHALAGVERLGRILTCERESEQQAMLEQYRRSLMEETRLLDDLVSTAYATLGDFERFTAACMLYFAGAIRCEERYQRGETPTHLWNADDPDFVSMTDWACETLRRGGPRFADEIREALSPWNQAGLMHPDNGNRYSYTATK